MDTQEHVFAKSEFGNSSECFCVQDRINLQTYSTFGHAKPVIKENIYNKDNNNIELNVDKLKQRYIFKISNLYMHGINVSETETFLLLSYLEL